MKKLLLILALFFIGCTPTPKPPADNQDELTFRIQPVIIANSQGQTRWSNSRLNERTALLPKIYGHTRLNFKVLPTKTIQNNELNEVSSYAEISRVQSLSVAEYKNNQVIVVYFVDKLSTGSTEWGGVASLPSNMSGFDHGVIISINSGLGVVGHELGHYFNLPHAWDNRDKYTDVFTENINDCVRSKCNIMNYCLQEQASSSCVGTQSISVTQKAEIELWMYSSNRIAALEQVGVAVRIVPKEMPRTERKLPIFD